MFTFLFTNELGEQEVWSLLPVIFTIYLRYVHACCYFVCVVVIVPDQSIYERPMVYLMPQRAGLLSFVTLRLVGFTHRRYFWALFPIREHKANVRQLSKAARGLFSLERMIRMAWRGMDFIESSGVISLRMMSLTTWDSITPLWGW